VYFISGPIGIDLSTHKLIYAKYDVSYLFKDYFEHKAQAKDILTLQIPRMPTLGNVRI